MNGIELRQGRWQEVLQGIEVDALIVDPPYGARTHKGHRVGVKGSENYMRVDKRDGSVVSSGKPKRKDIEYSSWSPEDVVEFVDSWAPRTRGWICAMTSHDLFSAWESTLLAHDRYVFAPIPIVIPGMTVRLTGDGPSSWCVWMVVSRPRSRQFSKWGTLPGAYWGKSGQKIVTGGKDLMVTTAIVSDYSRPGDIVCDPCAGGATTLIAAASLGRQAIGAEMDCKVFKKAQNRIARGYTSDLFASATEG